MSLEIFSGNKWHKFFINDLFHAQRMAEMKTLSCFASAVRASGEELQLIKGRMDNVPITRGGPCEWRNPFTAFILSNLIEASNEAQIKE